MEPRIYVASLTDYSNGILHGVWIDLADKDEGTIQEEIQAMLADSPTAKQEGSVAEEWAIHDHEGFSRGEPGEYARISDIVELVEFMKEASEIASDEAAKAWLDNGLSADVEAFRDAYQGCYESRGDWAEQLQEDTKGTKHLGWLAMYIDWDAVGRDAELNGDIWTAETGYNEVHVFWNH